MIDNNQANPGKRQAGPVKIIYLLTMESFILIKQKARQRLD